MKHRIALVGFDKDGTATRTTKTIDSDSYVITDGFIWFNKGNDLVYMVAQQYVLSVTVVR